jgi:hypothetical protein
MSFTCLSLRKHGEYRLLPREIRCDVSLLGADISAVGTVQRNELVVAIPYYGKSGFVGCYVTRNFLPM